MKSSPMQPSNKLLKESFEERAKGKIALFYFDKKEPALEFQRERS